MSYNNNLYDENDSSHLEGRIRIALILSLQYYMARRKRNNREVLCQSALVPSESFHMTSARRSAEIRIEWQQRIPCKATYAKCYKRGSRLVLSWWSTKNHTKFIDTSGQLRRV